MTEATSSGTPVQVAAIGAAVDLTNAYLSNQPQPLMKDTGEVGEIFYGFYERVIQAVIDHPYPPTAAMAAIPASKEDRSQDKGGKGD